MAPVPSVSGRRYKIVLTRRQTSARQPGSSPTRRRARVAEPLPPRAPARESELPEATPPQPPRPRRQQAAAALPASSRLLLAPHVASLCVSPARKQQEDKQARTRFRLDQGFLSVREFSRRSPWIAQAVCGLRHFSPRSGVGAPAGPAAFASGGDATRPRQAMWARARGRGRDGPLL